ncbi:MAG TPA: hypothetical protein PLM07_07870 [Candidatus Rifleibacterium sp.]|nr:hypothetical protein [Candidatus Rifleibacterium sp.]HPT45802.1 hypothetical protein [Candidatus Rifleibacterium sp.]
MNTRCKCLVSRLFGMLIILAVCCSSPATAQKTDQIINFNTPRVELIFQPSIRSGPNSAHPLHIELPRLNLIVNLIENYLQYLLRLQKIAAGSKVTLVYAPDIAIEDWNEDGRRLRINDTGINHVLQVVNQHLREQESTEKSFLLDSDDNLFAIPDNFPRKTSKIAIKTELVNHSSYQKSLEPDTDFCIVDEHHVVTARPFKRSNRLFLMTDSNGVCSSTLLLDQAPEWYANLSASADSKFIAFTDGMQPMVKPLGKGEPIKILPGTSRVTLLDMRWSPTGATLAGMTLDNLSLERQFFIFDATQGRLRTDLPLDRLEANYINAFPCWSPDGSRLLLTSARNAHLVDLASNSVSADILRLPSEIGEVVWSADSQSFALVEVIGQARSRYLFDDLDYRKTVLHRYRIMPNGTVNEDHAQRVESRNTIKLISFWTNDRVLYLEGRLMSKRLNLPFWDLSKNFSAFLTPAPTSATARDKAVSPTLTSPQPLPLQYVFVFRNLDGKYNNVYDAGFDHSNQIYVDNFTNIWFIGLRKPEEIMQKSNVFNFRFLPYPFAENNVAVFSDTSATKMELLLKFLQDYNLRAIRFNSDITRLFMLANFAGPLNLWSGDLVKLVEGLNRHDE